MLSRIAGVSFTLDGDGINPFETAPARGVADVREQLLSRPNVNEAFVLRTCQRFECYAEGRGAEKSIQENVVNEFIPGDSAEVLRVGEDVVEHLFRVACGLESGILGEDEIIGQVRNAYQEANTAGAIDATLDTLIMKAIHVGERARTETEINQGTVSLGSVTVDSIEDTLGDIAGVKVLVVGAGEVADLVVKALNHRDAHHVTITNRTLESARAIADEIDGDVVSLSQVRGQLSDIDAMITATGSVDPVFTRSDLAGQELVVIDLANPRDTAADVESIEDLELITLEEIVSKRAEGLEQRHEAIPAVESIIEEERNRLLEQLRAESVDETLSQFYSHAHNLRASEFDRATTRLDAVDATLSDEQEAVIRDFSEGLINKLLHPKSAALKQAAAKNDREMVDLWLRLFDEQLDGGIDAGASDTGVDRTAR